jgi:guanine deaminase
MPLSLKDTQFMHEAIAQAEKGVKKGQTPFGAVIVHKHKMIAAAHNQVWKLKDITAHAEIVALRRACQNLNQVHLAGATIYSTCEPCPMCMSACHWARIGRIVFGAYITDAAKFGFNELAISNRQMIKLGKLSIRLDSGFLRRECLEVFKKWHDAEKPFVY